MNISEDYKEKQRERLIELLDNSGFTVDTETSEDLTDYLIEKGVVVPPCKVGDTIYYIGNGIIQEMKIEFITITDSGFEYGLVFGDKTVTIYANWVGKELLHYTKEEAEKALKGRCSDE